MTGQLLNWKMNVREADSITEAMSQLKEAQKAQKPVELLVSDWTLEGSHGAELLTTLSKTEEFKDIPTLLLVPLSGEHMHFSNVTESRSLKMLSNPVSFSSLYESVLALLYPEEIQLQANRNGKRQSVKMLEGHAHHVLVAEDNRVNQIVVKAMLNESGLTCDIAQNGQEAFDLFLTGKYSVILMDCQMPLVDGYEATGMIRKWEEEHSVPRIPIIALTANAFTGDVQQCLDAGMDAFCSKPIEPVRLFGAIVSLLGIEEAWKSGIIGGAPLKTLCFSSRQFSVLRYTIAYEQKTQRTIRFLRSGKTTG